jgi:hypothetical protein
VSDSAMGAALDGLLSLGADHEQPSSAFRAALGFARTAYEQRRSADRGFAGFVLLIDRGWRCPSGLGIGKQRPLMPVSRAKP